jgi:hypothetical protein
MLTRDLRNEVKQAQKVPVDTSAAQLSRTESPSSGGFATSISFGQVPLLAPDENSSASSFACAGPRLPIQSKLKIPDAHDRLESEAEAVSERVMSVPERSQPGASAAPSRVSGNRYPLQSEGSSIPDLQAGSGADLTLTNAPRIVHEVLRSPGQPIDDPTRRFMETRFGRDFGDIRIHTDAHSEESARAVNAHAYTVGQNMVFGAGKYSPQTFEGKKLLAHELSHAIQQAQDAREIDRRTTQSATLGLYRQQAAASTPELQEVSFSLTWDELLNVQLTLPSLLAPRTPRPLLPSPGTLTLGGPKPSGLLGAGTTPSIMPAVPAQSLVPPTTTPPSTTPSPSSTSPAGAAPAAPSRVSLINSGRLSLGLRLGFPDLKEADKPGSPPSAAQEALRKGEILNQIITGQVPSAWQALDKGKLASAVWGIFATRIAPGVAQKITNSLSGKAGRAGLSYELDAVLLTDFSGGGLSFTLKY